MRAVAYLRVSSKDQVDGYSLDAQERNFREACKNRGWEIAGIYREEGRSAHSDSLAKRPMMRQLLKDTSRGMFDIVVVHTLDRWARNVEVLIRTIKMLKEHNVQLQSITESLDHSIPQGKLLLRLLGSFAEFSSDMLGEHVKKGLKERAMQGRHTGGIPFGYESCWINEGGEKSRRCDPEHPGGIHLVTREADAVMEAFKRYANGTTRLNDLANYFNSDLGLRTRNTKKLANGRGGLEAGPGLFTTFSIRGILHNRFYAGFVRHNDVWYPGSHEAVISIELYDQVQDALRKNNGRSATLNPRPEREYLLQGIVRCAYCLMPMWAQTYSSGRRYYREYRGSRGNAPCPAVSGSIPCEAADEQVKMIVQALELRESWMEEVMARIALKDQVEGVKRKRRLAFEKLQRLGKAYVDGVYQEEDYKREKRRLELDLESMVVPQVSAAEEAGRLLKELPSLWAGATMGERRKLLLAMLDGVYIETKELKRVLAIQPKPAFRPIFEVATMKAGSDLTLIKEPPASAQEAPSCSWWRRRSPHSHDDTLALIAEEQWGAILIRLDVR